MTAFRKNHVRLLVARVTLANEQTIAASTAVAQEHALSRRKQGEWVVPRLVWKWCPMDDKDGHSNQWTISVPRIR